MDFYRVYKYLKQGENIRHLHRDLRIIKERFDGDLFDLLAVQVAPGEDTQPVGVYIDDCVHKTQERIAESQHWREQNGVGFYVVTESPQQFTEGTIIPYCYKNGHRFHESADSFIISPELAQKGMELALTQLLRKYPLAKYARIALQLYKKR